MEQKSFSFPTETIELPSKGLLYPEDNPLSSGKIEMKYMTAREEDILTNQNYIKQGTVIDKLLQSMIVTKINYSDILVGDKDAIMLAARILGYGKDYVVDYYFKTLDEIQKITVDLTKIKEKALDENLVISPKKNEFSFKFSNTNNEVTFKLLTHGDENDIEKEIQGLKKINPQGTFDMSTRLKYIITSVNGSYDKKSIREFIDQGLIAKDARELRKYISEISPGIDLKYTHYFEDGGAEDIDIPIGVTFFWPDA
jgi:hypothetical protein